MEKENDDAGMSSADTANSNLTLDALVEKIKERHKALQKILNYLEKETSDNDKESANEVSDDTAGKSE